MIRKVVAVSAFVLPGALWADSMDSMKKAQELGNLLASEQFCDLSYDQDAISTWIDENTDPSDMGFAGSLSMMTQGTEFQLSSMSESAKTAHCRATERAATHFGFIQE